MDDPYRDIKVDRINQKKDVTARISETSRFVGFGMVAWVFAQHVSSAEFSIQYLAKFGEIVRIAGVLGVLAILLDYVQYIAAYASIEAAIKNKDDGYAYNHGSFAIRVQKSAFWLKQISAVGSALIVVVTFVASIGGTAP